MVIRHVAFCYLAEVEWRENRLKVERAWFLDRRERRAKPFKRFSNHLSFAM